jgi:hypothetical protein
MPRPGPHSLGNAFVPLEDPPFGTKGHVELDLFFPGGVSEEHLHLSPNVPHVN